MNHLNRKKTNFRFKALSCAAIFLRKFPVFVYLGGIISLFWNAILPPAHLTPLHPPFRCRLPMLKRLKVILVFSLLHLFTTATGCDVLYKSGLRQDGVYIIHPDDLGRFKVRCDMTTNRGGWTVIQKRQDGSEDFYRGWSDYKKGFGDLNGEFWLGLDKIHRLSKSGQNTLRVDLMNFNGAERYAKYESFGVADGSDEYRLNISGYSGSFILLPFKR